MPEITYTITRSARRRTVGITVRPDGTVSVRAPRGVPDRLIDGIVSEKAGWIQKKLDMNRAQRDRHPPKTYGEGDTFSFLGASYRLEHVAGLRGVAIVGDKLCIGVDGGMSSQQLEPGRIAARIKKWYRMHAAGIINGRVQHYSDLIGIKPAAIRFKKLKSRWGSCSSRGALNFNWLLVLAPLPVIDYVVVHELCHFLHPNHSSLFWDKVESILPDYRERRKWLRANGAALSID